MHRMKRILRHGLSCTLLALSALGMGQAWAQASRPAAMDSGSAEPRSGTTWSDADIRASRVETPGAKSLPAKPRWQADPMNLFVVVEAGDDHVSLLDGDRFEVLHRFPGRGALQGEPAFTPDGRFVYFGTGDGWITQYDLWNLTIVAEARAGLEMGNLALSADGRYLMVANSRPRNVVLLDGDLQFVKHIDAATLDGRQTSRVSAVYDAAPRKSFVVAFKDLSELWEVSYDEKAEPIFDGLVHDYKMGEAIAKPGFLNPRRAPLDEPLESFAFDPSYRNLLGAKRPRDGAPAVSTTVQVVNLDVRRKIAELPMAGMPQPGSGIRFAHHGTTVLASQNLQDGAIDVIDMKTWKVVKAIPTPGPGFFIRSHENTPFAWADSVIDPKSKDSLTLIDKKTLEPVATLRKPGHTLAQTAFTKDGRYALVSAADMDGALIAFDTETLKEIKRLPMRKPVGSYNVWNMITRSKRPSH